MKKISKVSQFDPNLVLWLRMQEGPNPVAFDYSGASNHGIIYGATWSSPGLFFDKPSSNYIDGGNNVSLNLTDITMSAWIKTPSINTKEAIIWKSNNPGYSVFVQNGEVLVEIGDGTGYNYMNSISTVNNNVWNHIVFAAYRSGWTNSRLDIYINGILDKTGYPNIWGSTANAINLQVGRASTILLSSFNGFIDDLRIYNRYLSSEANTLFQSTRSKYGV